MFKITIISIILGFFSLSQLAFSEELPEAGKRTNVDYFEIVLVKYKPGMADAAGEYIEKYFVAATKAAGTRSPFVMHMMTGKWDSVIFWKQQGGMGDFEWYMSADGVKWWAELAKQNGGAENAKKIMAGYQAMVATTSKQIGHHHMPEKEEAK